MALTRVLSYLFFQTQIFPIMTRLYLAFYFFTYIHFEKTILHALISTVQLKQTSIFGLNFFSVSISKSMFRAEKYFVS